MSSVLRIIAGLAFITSATAASARQPPRQETLQAVQDTNSGWAAPCIPSEIDELQMLRQPIRLTKEQAAVIAALLGNEKNYVKDNMEKFCTIAWDFKLMLFGEEKTTFVGVRCCSTCSVVGIEVNFHTKDGGELTKEAYVKLAAILESISPGWLHEFRKWERERRQRKPQE